MAPQTGPADADLWILAGQSNMVGAEPVTDPGTPDPRITMYSMSNEWMVALDPIHRYFEAVAPVHRQLFLNAAATPEARAAMERDLDAAREASRKHPIGGVGPGLAFAQAIRQATGRPVGLIPCAQGATSMGDWDPALKDRGDGSLYGAMLGRIGAVGGGARIKGVLWYQGESENSGELWKSYQAKLLNLVDSIRRDTGQPELPFIYVQIGRLVTPDKTPEPGWEKVREVQRQTAGLRKNLFMVPASDLPMTDHIHISAEGQRRLGRRMAEVALTHVYQKPGHGRPIELATVTVEEDTTRAQGVIRVRFSGVTGRLQAAGRPGEFTIRGAPVTPIPMEVYRVDLDPQDPAGLILRTAAPVKGKVELVCGGGLDPYMNIVDERDMAIPCFGPVALEP